jgi:hypothetical protein
MTESELETRRLELAERQEARIAAAQRAVGLSLLLESLAGRVAPGVLELFRVKIAQELAQQDFSSLLPKKDYLWETPSQIARRWGVPSRRVGKIISELGIRDPAAYPKMCEAYDNVATDTSRKVVCYRYSPEAVAMIERRLMALEV